MKYLALLVIVVLPAVQEDAAKEIRELIQKLGVERPEEREEAARKLKVSGEPVLPFLEKAAGHPDAEIAARARLLIRTIGIRKQFSAGFLRAFPNADDRLAAGEAPVWTENFLEAAKESEGKPVYPAVEAGDLAALAPKALQGARETGEHQKVCEALGKRRVSAAVPSMIDWIRKNEKCTFSMARALGGIGDPRSVPVLLDYPNLLDFDVVGSTKPYLKAFGPSAYPEYERRILAWKSELEAGKREGLSLSLFLRGSGGGDAIDRARLDLLDHLIARLPKPPRDQSFDDRFVFADVVWAVAERHPERAIEAFQQTVDSHWIFGTTIFRSADVPKQVAKPIVARLWKDLKGRPNLNERVREYTLRYVGMLVPEELSTTADPITSAEEARQVLSSLGYQTDSDTVRKAIERIDFFLASTPDPLTQYSLALFHERRGELERCEALLDRAMPDLARADFLIGAYFHRSNVRLQFGRFNEAGEDVRKALEIKKANPQSGPIAVDTMEKRLNILASYPKDPKVGYLSGFLLPWRGRTAPDIALRYRQTSGSRAFYIGQENTLCAADPFRRETIVLRHLETKVRDFMPLDPHRVFVAHQNATAAVYKEGERAPVWTRKLSLGFNSFLTASPGAITATEEDGTFHALNPETGATLWTRRAEGKPWPDLFWRSERGNIAQGAERVILPAVGGRFEVVDVPTGKSVGTVPGGFAPAKLLAGREAFIIADARGDVAAFRMKDGSSLWTKKLEASADYPLQDISLALQADEKVFHIAIEDRLFTLDAATGDVVWKWTWKPKEGSGTPSESREVRWPNLRAAEDGLYLVLNWETPRPSPETKADVVFFSREGAPLFQYTSPKGLSQSTYYGEDPFVVGRDLALHKGGWEIWKRSDR